MQQNREPDWKRYQSDVGELFSELGFSVSVEEKILGARGSHDIDVVARMKSAGVDQMWIIECKKWRRPVPKERILTFASIISDIGADRGLVFCESGFQAGAVRMSLNSNITLTSLSDFRQNTAEEIASIRVAKLKQKILELSNKYASVWDLEKNERERVQSRYVGPLAFGIDRIPVVPARLSQMRDSLEMAQFGRWPVPYWPLDDKGTGGINVKAWDGLFFMVEKTIETCSRLYENMMSLEPVIADWIVLQPKELTDLLKAVLQNSREERRPE